MGTSLNGTTPATTYPSLIKFGDNSAIAAALKQLSDGNGNNTSIWLSPTNVNIGGTGTINSILGIKGSGSTSATYSLWAENSVGNQILVFRDDGSLVIQSGGSASTINGTGSRFYQVQSPNGASMLYLDGGACQLRNDLGATILNILSTGSSFNDSLAIGTNVAANSSSLVELVSTTKGFLPPRMTTAQRDAIATPAEGLMLYNTTSKTYQYRINGNWEEFGSQSNAITAATAAINTAETIVVQSPVLTASRFMTSTIIRIEFSGTCTSTAGNTSTFRVRIGTAGTTADGIVMSITTAAAALSGTNVAFSGEIDMTIRTIGASATAFGYLTLWNQGTTGIATTSVQVIQGTMTAFNSTTANFVSLTYQSAAATTTSTFQLAQIEVID